MADDDVEYSESGSPIYRHKPREKDFQFPKGDDAAIDQIVEHITKHIGEPATVYHEMISDLVHVDVHVVKPTPERDFYTLVTSGMSDLPMNCPPDFPDLKYAELMLCLPPDWPLSGEEFKQEESYWPIHWLKMLARLPHEYDTWLCFGHTVPNGDPPEPFAANTGLCCSLLLVPLTLDDAFLKLKVSDEKTINFYCLIPIYREEMEFKLKHGLDPLIELLDGHKVTELLDVKRTNVCRKRLFGLL